MMSYVAALILLFDAPDAERVVTCAFEAQSDNFSAQLLLAIAKIESDFRPDVASQVVNGRRVGGHLKSYSRGPFFCGLLQVDARRPNTLKVHPTNDRRRCRRYMRRTCDVFHKGVAELEWWLKFCRGNVECALAGYNAGVRAARRGTSRYARRVLRTAVRLESTHRAVFLISRT